MNVVATLSGGALTGAPDRTAEFAASIPPEPCAADEPPDRTDTAWDLTHHPTSAGDARRITRAALHAWGVDEDTTDQALLVVSELVTNAVEHALPPITLHLGRPAQGDALHIEVDDGGPASQEGDWTAGCAPDEHGRGRDVVAALATAHGHRTGIHGATYWADL